MIIVQINLNHCQTAQDIVTQMAIDKGADVVLVSEPYRIPESSTWVCDKSKKAAIWTCEKHAIQEIDDNFEGFVRARVGGIDYFSCYAPPSKTQDEYQALLDNITAEATGRNPIVIGGDFNAWATEWGSRFTNTRGRTLLESFAALNIVLANEGDTLTYRKAGAGSIIDITFVSNSLANKTKWQVSEEYTHSDHQAVIIEIKQEKATQAPRLTGPKWKDTLFDREMFEYTLDQFTLSPGPVERRAKQLMHFVATACDASMPRRKVNNKRPPAYWWNDEIKKLRAECQIISCQSEHIVFFLLL